MGRPARFPRRVAAGALAWVVTLLSSSGELRAQESRDSTVAAALTRFAVGDPIRVALLRSRFSGRLVGVSGDTVYFGSAGQQPMAFRFNAVDSLWRSGRATGRGARIGALTGMAVGSIAFGVVAARRDESDLFQGMLVGAVSGALGGAFLGAAIGSATRWRLVFP